MSALDRDDLATLIRALGAETGAPASHVEAERDEWLPPIVSDRLVDAPWKTAQDNVFDVFGTGSGCPFAVRPRLPA